MFGFGTRKPTAVFSPLTLGSTLQFFIDPANPASYTSSLFADLVIHNLAPPGGNMVGHASGHALTIGGFGDVINFKPTFKSTNAGQTTSQISLTVMGHTIAYIIQDLGGVGGNEEPIAISGGGNVLYNFNGGIPAIYKTGTGGTSYKSAPPGWMAGGSPKVIMYVFDGTHAGHRVFVNGSEVMYGGAQFVNDPGLDPLHGTLCLGSETGGANWVDALFGPVVVCDQSIYGTNNFDLLTTWLMDWAGI